MTQQISGATNQTPKPFVCGRGISRTRNSLPVILIGRRAYHLQRLLLSQHLGSLDASIFFTFTEPLLHLAPGECTRYWNHDSAINRPILCNLQSTDYEMDVEHEVTPEPAVIHHGSLFLPDGDLVIGSSVENEKRTLIRVHSALVSCHSPVFRDMLSFPSGGCERELYGGVPLVLLPDDMEDIIALFDVFYKPG